ncbi:MAG: hypothetical protein KF757_04590 [Phycisphaeraceae bacterium]|nr:hypothetical protein [Phycisphaeraceae bacterium]MCW5764273.1 hypothetical protein [Phycisphaeraceae bacterium]
MPGPALPLFPVGNMTDDGQHYEYVYDPFGRLRKVVERGSSPAVLVAEYRYNGLNFRIGQHTDLTDDGTNDLPDGVVDADDPWFWFCYDEHWRIVATFRSDDEHPKEVFIHHNAGLDGVGGSSYIDSIIMRDRDANTVWFEEADSTREERSASRYRPSTRPDQPRGPSRPHQGLFGLAQRFEEGSSRRRKPRARPPTPSRV